MRVAILGDIHQDLTFLDFALAAAKNAGADMMIQVGDFGFNYSYEFMDHLQTVTNKHHLPLYVMRGNHDCLSSSTTLMTRRGFVPYSDIRDDDEVYGQDSSGKFLWQPIQSKIVKNFSGKMVRLRKPKVEMVMTPNHRVVYENSIGEQAEFLAKDKSAPPSGKIIRAGIVDRPDHNISDDQLRLIAWCVTDSHKDKNGYWNFYQKESDSSRIEAILDKSGFSYRKSVRVRDIKQICGKTLKQKPEAGVEYRLNADSSRRIAWSTDALPELVWKLSTRQVQVLLEELVFTDGTWSTSTKTGAGYAGVIYALPESVHEQMMILLTEHGFRCSESRFYENELRLNFTSRRTQEFNKNVEYDEIDYDDQVWCLTTKTGNFFVKNGESTFLTGNCPSWFKSYYRTGYVNFIPDGTFMTVGKKRVAFLGGAVSIDRKFRQQHVSWWPEERVNPNVVRSFAHDNQTADVLISHESPIVPPNLGPPPMKIDADIQIDCDDDRLWVSSAAEILGVAEVYHGHYHHRETYELSYEDNKKVLVEALDCNYGFSLEDAMVIREF